MTDRPDFADLMARLKGEIPSYPNRFPGVPDLSKGCLDWAALEAERAEALSAIKALVEERQAWPHVLKAAAEMAKKKHAEHLAREKAAHRAGWDEAREKAARIADATDDMAAAILIRAIEPEPPR